MPSLRCSSCGKTVFGEDECGPLAPVMARYPSMVTAFCAECCSPKDDLGAELGGSGEPYQAALASYMKGRD